MATVTIDEDKLKDLLKSALIEALEERREIVQEIVEEAIEDFGLAHAIKQGLDSESVPREEVFAILKDAGE